VTAYQEQEFVVREYWAVDVPGAIARGPQPPRVGSLRRDRVGDRWMIMFDDGRATPAGAATAETRQAVMLVDLDRFASVNETFDRSDYA
jgi:hypothetical protein